MNNPSAARVGALVAMCGLLTACAGAPASTPSAPSSSAPAASASSTTASSAPAVPSVAISKGSSAKGLPGCSSASCAYVLVTTKDFSGGYTCTWWGSAGGNWASKAFAGNVTNAMYAYYGFPDSQVRVTCGGVRSNTIKW